MGGLLVVLHKCKTWPVTLREEHRLRVFVLRKISRLRRDNVTWKWSRLHMKDLHDLYSSPFGLSFKFHLLSFHRSVQDYKIHVDMEIVIFLESRGETNLEVYSKHMVQYSI